MNDRRTWLALSVVALATAASALAPQPEGLDVAQAGSARFFAALITAALVGIAVLPAVLRRTALRRRVWIVVATLSLALGAAAFVAAGSAQRACTARYDGRPTIVGTEWTPLGASYAKANPGLSRDELLFDSAGVAARMWTQQSIDRCRVLVGGTYAIWIPFLAVCIFGALQSAASPQLPVGPARSSAGGGETPHVGGEPTDDLRYDVFISYRHGGHDTEFARELLSALERAGYAVAIDERDFPANASFLHEMERCIRQSRFTVALISSRYLGSGNCEEEATICKVLDMGDRRRRLIPLMIEAVPVPAWLFGIVGIDCTKPDPLVDPFEKLRATLGPPSSRAGRPAVV